MQSLFEAVSIEKASMELLIDLSVGLLSCWEYRAVGSDLSMEFGW